MSSHSIPLKRLLLYIIITLFAAPLITYIWQDSTLNQLARAHSTISHLQFTLENPTPKIRYNRLAKANFSKNSDFLEKTLESSTLLNDEKKTLENILLNKQNPDYFQARQRLLFLRENNKISFTEKEKKRTKYIQETELTFPNPTEMSEADITHILTSIEKIDFSQKKPQFLIKNFHLERKPSITQDVFQVTCTLLNREFTP